MHVHLMVALSAAYELEKITLGAPDLAFLAAWNAEQTLMAGFTTVRDLGDRADVTVALRFTAVRSRISLTSILSCEYTVQFDVSLQIPCEKCANPMRFSANAQKSWTLLVPGRCKWRRRPVFPGHRAEIRNVRGNSRGHQRFRVHPDKWRWRIRRRRIQGAARVHRGRRDGEGDCGALSAE